MRRWPADVLASLTDALSRARSGQPTVLVLEGEPGMGKSSLLDDAIAQARPEFQVLRSEGLETGAAQSYAVIVRWGADLSSASGGDALPDVVAAQRLRQLVDAAAEQGPVMLVLDDLQWADPESVEAVLDLLRRAAGDRLLLAVATRPLPSTRHAGWQRWAERSEQVIHLRLTGLALQDALALMSDVRSDLPAATAEALWQHTGGNPLYLRALLAEYEPGELGGVQVLPAPAAYLQSVVAQLDRLPADVVRVAEAVAVLGSGWSGALEVNALASAAGVAGGADAVQRLVDAGLLQLGRMGATVNVRPSHALVRAAIYQNTPLTVQRDLHAAAATIVAGRGAVLDHRVAAAEQYDAALADDLEAYAQELHQRRSYRLAAHFWEAAAAVSKSPDERERRELEALLEILWSGDRATVHAALDQLPESANHLLRALVKGALAIWERRPFDAVEILASDRLSATHARDRYRHAVLLAWGRMQSGAATPLIQEAIDGVADTGEPDVALRSLELVTFGLLISRRDTADQALQLVQSVPANPAATPPQLTPALTWRGSLLGAVGRFSGAVADLTVITDRVHQGQVDVNGGSMHALLGRAQWFTGQWGLARVNLRTAADLSREYHHPLVVAVAPLIAISEGDFDAADAALAQADELLSRTPWLEALDIFAVTLVTRFHAQGAVPADLYGRLRPAVREVREGVLRKNAVWLLHTALAALWANELGDAQFCAERVRDLPVETSWHRACSEWVFGLVAEARGKGKLALGHLRAAVSDHCDEIPLYRAHALLDHARLAHLLGDPAGSAQSLERAAQIYGDLGAGSYVRRVDELRRAEKPTTSEPTITLSERERDVLTLLADGLSYAQIARDLFITQSTVSYHLGNIYAKADVSSRHQLTDLVRARPAVFGLAAALGA